MKALFFVLFLLSIKIALANWSTPKMIRMNDTNGTMGVYTDNNTSKTYIFYAYNEINEINVDSYLCYREFTPIEGNAEPTVKEECFKQKRMVLNVSATGDNNGKNIYVIYNARRRMRATDCGTTPNEGCIDVYFMETADGGKTWTEPIPIPRSNMNDGIHRIHPKIISVVEKSRLFVAYLQQNPSGSTFYIFQASRANGSKIFTNEATIDNWSYIHDIALAYTINGEEVTVNILCAYSFTNFVRYYTTNNWVGRNTQPMRSDSRDYAFSVSTTAEKDELYIISVANNSVLMLQWIEPGNLLHSRSFKLQTRPEGYRPLIVAFPDTNHTVLFTGTIGSSYVSTYIFNTDYEYLQNTYEKAPISAYPDSASTEYKTAGKARVLYAENNSVYTTSYTFVGASQ